MEFPESVFKDTPQNGPARYRLYGSLCSDGGQQHTSHWIDWPGALPNFDSFPSRSSTFQRELAAVTTRNACSVRPCLINNPLRVTQVGRPIGEGPPLAPTPARAKAGARRSQVRSSTLLTNAPRLVMRRTAAGRATLPSMCINTVENTKGDPAKRKAKQARQARQLVAGHRPALLRRQLAVPQASSPSNKTAVPRKGQEAKVSCNLEHIQQLR